MNIEKHEQSNRIMKKIVTLVSEEAGVYMGKQHELLTDMNSEWPSRQLATATALQKLVGEDCLANINALKQPQIPQLQVGSSSLIQFKLPEFGAWDIDGQGWLIIIK